MLQYEQLGFDVESYFRRFGGTALGLKLASEVAARVPGIHTPSFVPVKLDRLALCDRGVPEELRPLAGKAVVVHGSGPREAFSSHQVRGARHPFKGVRLRMHMELDLQALLARLGGDADACSLVFQEMVENPGLGVIYTQWDGTRTAFEFRIARDTFYVEALGGKVQYRESTRRDRNTNLLESLVDLPGLLELHEQLERQLSGQPFSAEVLFDNRQLTILQLRGPLMDAPQDATFTLNLRDWEARYERHGATRFVWGAFDCEGPVIGVDELAGVPGLAAEGTKLVLVHQRPVWADERVRRLLEDGTRLLFLDTEEGFRLSHPAILLPPAGPLRDRFQYIALPWLLPEDLLGKVVRVVSDGQEGILLEPRAEAGLQGAAGAFDRRRTDLPASRRGSVTFTPLPPGHVPPFSQVTSVGVIAFTPDGKHLVTTLQSRGIDLPGGHVRKEERSVEEVARREALEEAQVELGPIAFVRAWSSDFYGTAPHELTYLVTVAAVIERIHPFSPNLSHARRLFLTPEQFLSVYSGGDRQRMADLVADTHRLLFPPDARTAQPRRL